MLKKGGSHAVRRSRRKEKVKRKCGKFKQTNKQTNKQTKKKKKERAFVKASIDFYIVRYSATVASQAAATRCLRYNSGQHPSELDTRKGTDKQLGI